MDLEMAVEAEVATVVTKITALSIIGMIISFASIEPSFAQERTARDFFRATRNLTFYDEAQLTVLSDLSFLVQIEDPQVRLLTQLSKTDPALHPYADSQNNQWTLSSTSHSQVAKNLFVLLKDFHEHWEKENQKRIKNLRKDGVNGEEIKNRQNPVLKRTPELMADWIQAPETHPFQSVRYTSHYDGWVEYYGVPDSLFFVYRIVSHPHQKDSQAARASAAEYGLLIPNSLVRLSYNVGSSRTMLGLNYFFRKTRNFETAKTVFIGDAFDQLFSDPAMKPIFNRHFSDGSFGIHSKPRTSHGMYIRFSYKPN